MASKIGEDDALADIRRVATEIGEPPSVAQYREHGNYSARGVATKFGGSFVTAREKAGVADGELRPNSRAELISDIQRVAQEIGHEPSKDEYKEHGDYALSGITYRFESWVDAKKEAGVYEGGLGSSREITREKLLEDIRRVAETAGEPLSYSDYNEHGDYHSKTILRNVGRWKEVCAEIGVQTPNHGTKWASDGEIIDDIQRVKDEIGHYPSKIEYNEHGEYTEGIGKARFGTWMNALETAGFDGNPQDGERNPNWTDDPKYEAYTHRKWKENRPKALERDNYECQHCSMTRDEHLAEFGADLSVHHITREHWPDDPAKHHALENLVTLCKPHHQLWEGTGLAPKENRG